MVWESKDRITAAEPTQELVLDHKVQNAVKALCKLYPTKQAALLPALHKVQAELGNLSDQAMIEIAQLLEISPAQVLDTAGFYDMYTREKRGKHLIGVCESLSCELCGCEELLAILKKKLKIEPGQTTGDGKFTLITMQCIGACDFAPAMLIDDKLYKTVTPEQLDKILLDIDK
ncbi:MAG: NADH-quinone oxidoreductase subunit NuoE [Planctomycetes bacterium]|nr:NADH-quinone oxidoreductase subunit NuoE [Planctomycetota bacterium]